MNPDDARLHDKLQSRIDDARTKLASALPVPGGAPTTGDLYWFEETAGIGIEWLLVAVDEEDPSFFLALPTDSLPLLGTRDVEIARRLTVRCGHPLRLPVRSLEESRRTRRIDREAVERVREHELAVRAGEAPQWSDLVEVDGDVEYRDWLRTLDRGRHVLIAILAQKDEIARRLLTEAALRLYVNGIDGDSGRYLQAPLPLVAAAAQARGMSWDPAVRRLLDQVDMNHRQAFLGLPAGADPLNLRQTGWGVVLPSDAADEVRAAIEPLVEHRRAAAGNRLHVLEYRAGESWREWLARHGVAAADEVDPRRIPYYLLLVGSPEEIPFEFEQVLGIEYAVGRLCFDAEDDPVAALRRYALNVVEQETTTAQAAEPEAVFFAPRHADDPLTVMTAEHLMMPLMDDLNGLTMRRLWGGGATRKALLEAFEQSGPRLLVAAAHGIGYGPGHPLQRDRQGALICQDWPGGRIDEEHLFSAAALDAECRVDGTIALFFASFGAGTAEFDEALREPGGEAPRLTPKPFVARLPQRLLAHENGGALAVLGLADRAWGFALAAAAEDSARPLREVVQRLADGKPVGYAAQAFNESHAAVSVDLGKMLEKARFGGRIDEGRLTRAWIERNHSQSWVVVGDPAVRLNR